jgi:hypothetical protein
LQKRRWAKRLEFLRRAQGNNNSAETARLLGLTVPSLLARADEVIE